MQNNNRKIFDSLLSRTKVYIVLIFISAIYIIIINSVNSTEFILTLHIIQIKKILIIY